MRGLRRWWDDSAGGLPATFWYLWSGLLINRAGAFAMLFLSLYLTAARGASPALAGLVVGAYGAGGAAGTLLGGVLADRWGRRATLLAAHLGAAGLMVALAFSRHLLVIAVLAALVGVVHSMPSPAFVAAIVDVVPEDRRARAFNLQFWAFNLGMAVASLLAGVLAEASFLALFLVDAGTTLAAAAVLALKVPETLDRRIRVPATTGRRPGLHTALTDRVFLVFVGLTFLLAVLTMQTSTIMPLAMRDDGLRPSAYGMVVALGGALIVAGQLFVPRLIAPYRKATVLSVSTGLMALGFGVLAVADELPLYLGAAVVWTVGQMLAAPPNAQINADLAPPELRARYQSVFYLTFPAASFVAPALGGLSLEHLGERHWLVVGALGLVAAAGHLLAGPSRERRVDTLRAAVAGREKALAGKR
ncbi:MULTISPECIES: MFS transporter [Micromonospora]|uniref:MFS transporter n=1 Tax=Micromonospora solifontis TaxID=2487138 RepID=A0ABX9WMK7_9ACTN|nr:MULTISPECIES: MFS transporter [Micromonospora]NES15641.1 MFS transporter [Micromonospora sp. PPF5-17B]NES35941.1 MFS transporter [Micromonospora solifontis]NES56986.1 MFS transporter [Micromonospora sp. PPF5-6]RNM00049.1 MFS transporter [Micromonospora solifontis]